MVTLGEVGVVLGGGGVVIGVVEGLIDITAVVIAGAGILVFPISTLI